MAMSQDARPIGVFDSGIGGLTVARELLRQLPDEPLLYFGDTARVPYGSKSGETVIRFTLEAGEFLRGQGIKALVVACNTASAYALPALAERLALPVIGVIESGARAAAEVAPRGRIGVIGTAATIASRAYEEELARVAPGARVFAAACPLLVPLIEEGWLDRAATRLVAEEYLAPLVAERLDALILGCTHYPLLRPLLQQVMGEGVQLVDAGHHTAVAVAERLGASGRAGPSPAPPEHRVFLTDLPLAFRATSERFLGRALPPVELVRRMEERWVRA
jgi:glutamate racemase